MRTSDIANPSIGSLTWRASLTWALFAATCFHLAFLYSNRFPVLGALVLGYLAGLWTLRRQATPRATFWWGTAVGLACLGPQTAFLWTVFKIPFAGLQIAPIAPVLWLLVSLWHGVFLNLVRLTEQRWGKTRGWLTVPILWLGLEYFRCEVWWLRFSWMAVGDCFVGPPNWWRHFGVYGLGLIAWSFVVFGRMLGDNDSGRRRCGLVGLASLLALLELTGRPAPTPDTRAESTVQIAGLQWEFPSEPELIKALNRLIQQHPNSELIVLSEYTFDSPPPAVIRKWCREKRRWLLLGGKESITTTSQLAATKGRPTSLTQKTDDSVGEFRNTAFVVNPEGEIVFTQAKAQPIQFFNDGLPAVTQKVWESPWGPIGIAICYDAGYRRIMDPLIHQGARALLLPTMDLWEWGRHEHTLNARQAQLRAREYGVPVLRLASSGESLLLDQFGSVTASAPLEEPGTGNVLVGTMTLAPTATRPPLDVWLGAAALIVTLIGSLTLLLRRLTILSEVRPGRSCQADA